MIDVLSVIANFLWILGLSLLLAALSWANWAAKMSGTRLRSVLARPSIRRALDFGLALFCTGLAATAQRGWEKALWALLALVFAGQGVWSLRDRSEQRDENR